MTHPATPINLMTESKTGCNSINTLQDATRRFITGRVSVDTFLVRLVAEAAKAEAGFQLNDREKSRSILTARRASEDEFGVGTHL